MKQKVKKKQKQKQKPWQQLTFYTSLLLCATTFVLATGGLFLYSREQQRIISEARKTAKRQTVRAALEIDRELRVAKDTTLAIANDLTSGRLNDAQVLSRLKAELEKKPQLLDVGLAYEPRAYDPNVMLYAPYYARLNGELQSLEVKYNYTRPKYAWYRNTLSKGAHWGEPYFWQDNSLFNQPAVGYLAPFYSRGDRKQRPRGIVYADYSVETISDIVKSLDLGKTGYGFLVSRTGNFLYHPNEEYVKSQANIFDLVYDRNESQVRPLVDLVARALRGEPVEADLSDNITGQNSWVFLRQANQNGWVVGVVFIQDEVLPDNQTTRRQLIFLSLAFVWFFVFLFVLLFRTDKGTVKRLSVLSSTASLLFIAEIGFIWSLAIKTRTYTSTRNLLLNETGVDQLLLPQVELSAKLNQKPPLLVPTGVYIQSLDFTSSNDVFVTGYIWQEYQEGIHDELERGFILPDAIDANDLEVTEAYRHQEENDDVEVIGWYVEATLRQDLDFSNYPFDYKDVKIRLLHQDFNRRELNRQVILVPDLGGYQVINPRTKPGVDKDIVLGNWNLSDSFFEYRFKTYDTNFGIKSNVFKTNFPELNFTIVLQRDFIGPFISRVGPLFVVVTLLFAMLLIADEEKASEVLAACAGFVFIVILDQIAVREQIVTKGILYFEYFYFVIYFYIFLVAVNAILLLSHPNAPFIKYKDNLISKLLYWPTLLKTLLVITILVFA
ncbi:MAG: Cache 3/Cache 2 fusion domain-containing protein [Hormoscilla sp.]